MFKFSSLNEKTATYPVNKLADNRLTVKVVDEFIEALTELESTRDVEPLIALFSAGCEIGNAATAGKLYGTAGARLFWTNYRAAFKDVCSIFQNEIYSGSEAKLEWTTEGRSINGQKIKYSGTSIFETEGGKVTRFHAYFDQKDLARQLSRRLARSSGSGAAILNFPKPSYKS